MLFKNLPFLAVHAAISPANLKALLYIQFWFVKAETNEAIILIEEKETTLNSSRIARVCLLQTYVEEGLLHMELCLSPHPHPRPRCMYWSPSQVALVVKKPPASAGDIRDTGSIPGLGRSPGERHNMLQYSCLENPMDRGACRATDQRLTKRRHTWAANLADTLILDIQPPELWEDSFLLFHQPELWEKRTRSKN